MAVPSISPIAPARVGALLVPVGRIKRSVFDSCVERLRPENVVRLGDISPDSRPDRTMFSPLAFPNGMVLYNFTVSKPLEDQARLFPFETFREPLVVIGIAHGEELIPLPATNGDGHESSSTGSGLEELPGSLETLREQHPKAMAAELVVFDFDELSGHILPTSIHGVPPLDKSRSTTMKTLMCDISASFLSELSIFGRDVQASESIESPADSRTTNHSTLNRSHTVDVVDAGEAEPEATGKRSRMTQRASSMTLSPPSNKISRSNSPAQRPQSVIGGTGDDATGLGITGATGDMTPEKKKDKRSMKQTATINAADTFKNQLHSRQGIVIGTLHLQAGRWADALRELVDNTTRARATGDHVWHAKGLENILVTMLMLAWSRIEFTVPSICYPVEKASAAKNVPSSNLVRTSESIDGDRESASRVLVTLSTIVPDLIHMIITLHERAAMFEGDKLPQYPFSECIIRLAYLLTVFRKIKGNLTTRVLKHVVQGRVASSDTGPFEETQLMPMASKKEISVLLFKAFPPELLDASARSLFDTVMIFSGMITVLSFAQLYRKRALVIRDMLSILIPRLIQARKVGAAELGIHPAASLAAQHGLTIDSHSGSPLTNNGRIEDALHNLMSLLCATFGIGNAEQAHAPSKPADRRNLVPNQEDQASSPSDSILRVLEEIPQRNFGSFTLKMDILRLCANFSESLPNFADVVHFTAALLKTAGPGSAPSEEKDDISIPLPPEEQARFAGKIYRTLSVFKAKDAAKLEAEFWDPFLVRDVDVVHSPDFSFIPVSSSGSIEPTGQPDEAAAAAAATIPPNPFIHDALDPKVSTNIQAQRTLVAGETTTLAITLQNLYDFEIYVESIDPITTGVPFTTKAHSLILAPRRRTQILIPGVATTKGFLRVCGFTAKLQGCRKQRFDIFPEPWSPKPEVKLKRSGLSALKSEKAVSRPTTSSSDGKDKGVSVSTTASGFESLGTAPKAREYTFEVTSAQPLMRVTGTSLIQSTLTVLQGERQQFEVELKNVSESLPVDFVQLSTTAGIGDIDTESTPFIIQEVTKFEDESAQSNVSVTPIQWQWSSSHAHPIPPSTSAKIMVSVHGSTTDLSDFQLNIHYAKLDTEEEEQDSSSPSKKSQSKTPAQLLTRTLTLPLRVSVAITITLQNLDILSDPLNSDPPQQEQQQQPQEKEITIIVDIHNHHVHPLSLTFPSPNPTITPPTSHTIAPNSTSRILQPIPLLPADAPTPELQHLSQTLTPTWTTRSTGPSAAKRTGTISLLSPGEARTQEQLRSLDLRQLRADPVAVKLRLTSNEGEKDTKDEGGAGVRNRNTVAQANTLHTLHITLRNSTRTPITHPLLVRVCVRASPSSASPANISPPNTSHASNAAHEEDADNETLLWSGPVTRCVHGLGTATTAAAAAAAGDGVTDAGAGAGAGTVEWGVCFLQAGRVHEILATVTAVAGACGESEGVVFGKGCIRVFVVDVDEKDDM
ncbi:MAG: hypothetical protein M1831_005526 [Alyxoria varia]|nr:MAG: hypothetical protein M1831_005526 [Alyxoria varia]